MPRESGPPGPAQESLLGSEEAAPELNAFEAFRAGRKLVMNPADHLRDYYDTPKSATPLCSHAARSPPVAAELALAFCARLRPVQDASAP